MEPKPESLWDNKTEVKKGNIGEAIVRRLLEKWRWIVYAPETDGAHAFDRLCVRDKKEMMIVEIKTKARMTYYNGTGFNTSALQTYKDIQERHGLKVLILFVDEHTATVYGNYLDDISLPVKEGKYKYPLEVGKTTVFHLKNMRTVAKLQQEEIKAIKEYTRRNYSYERNKAERAKNV